MNLQQMKYFMAVVEHKSFSKAAYALHVSQPSLSQAVQALEDELGFALLIRTREGSVTNDMGEIVYASMQKIMVSINTETSNWLKIYQERVSLDGMVRIGCVPGMHPLLMEYILKRLEQSYPNVKYKILEARNNVLLDYLVDGQIELVLSDYINPKQAQMEAFVKDNELELTVLKEDAYKIAVSVNNFLAAQECLMAQDVCDLPLACYSGGDDAADLYFAKYFNQNICMEFNSFEKMIRAAIDNYAVSILPELTSLHSLRLEYGNKDVVRFLTVEGFYVPFTHYVCIRKNETKSLELMAVVNLIKVILKNLSAPN